MSRRAAAALAVLALVGLVVSGTVVFSRLGPTGTTPGAGPGPASEQAVTTAPPTTPAVRATDAAPGPGVPSRTAAPSRITLPSVEVTAPVRPVGVDEDGQMALPDDPRVFGWYRFGPAPGTDTGGSVVVAGHVDSERFGVGPLVRLREVEVGDRVEVVLTDGARAAYEVVDVRRFDRQALPDELFARTGPERLRLITCAGAYDADAGGYQQNLVVTAAPA